MQNLKDLVEVFGVENIKPSFTIKEPNILDTKNVISFFKETFGLEVDIGADVYDEFCGLIKPIAYNYKNF
ncbi:MAG: hypothetical protein HUJ68_03935 [Clostridia bacterium]|nr:hypothetical protein [Clostridia bacterium]